MVNMALLRCCVLLALSTMVSAQTTDRLVTIDQGPVRGYLSSQDNEVVAFYGIPYATAPTGRDKFKAPLPPPVWTEVFEATNDLILCPQPHLPSREDCLVVNVYSPATQQGPLPVMAYTHGGGFTMGYGAMTSPEQLVKQGVVVVTFNYRLGATGFLCLKNENIPGNAGVKDQVAALRWIQRNINSFGGNPNDVTIAGYSAGSVCVEYMMLSPMASGLFHKVISESGSVLSPFSESRDPIAFAKRFVADMVGQNVDDLAEIEEYLLNASPEVLLTDLYQDDIDTSMGLSPCVEQEIDGIESFLTESPLKILQSGNYNKVPYLTGTTSLDGSLRLPIFDDWKTKMEDNFADFLPVGLNFANENVKKEVAQRVKQFYFNNEPVSDETIKGFVDFSTDIIFGYPSLRSARLHVQNEVPVFLYSFSYVVSEYPSHIHDDKIRGAIHGAQSFCVNRIPWLHNPVSESENDIRMRNRLTKMWSDFVKNGVPVPETSELVSVNWEPMEYDKMNYLSMDVEMESRELLLGDRFTLWDEIYQQYYGSTDETGQSVVVDIEQGPVRGYKSPLGEFYVFNGIPYATAPIGRDKFKAPLPPPTWTNVFEATNSNIMCHQPGFAGLTQDDCLVVNIHTPINRQGHVPVMFYIHGGGFTQGYGAMVSPEDLVEHKLVVVTINYRLGATGFVCMRDEDIPGNAAYKDQIAALRWVQQNIASFGGNPNDVTIAGFSGGGISVEFMMLSPIANGLFHKVISESGSVLIPFSEGRDPIAFAKRFASDIAGNDIDDLEEVKQLLLDATSEELFTDLYESYQYRQDASMGFTFCVEDEIDGIESFLTEAPLEVLKKGNYNKVTIMTGIASEEGSIYLPYFDDWKPEMNEHFDHFIPVGLNFANENEKNAVANRVKQFYFNNEPVSDENIRGFMDFGTDISFGYALLRSARLHVQNSVPVYLYLYTYIVSEYPRHAHDDKIRGAIHCAQSFCVNRIPWLHNRVSESENDILMRNRLTKMWSDFAKTGVPVPQTSELVSVNWEPMEYDKMNYLSMDVEMESRELLLGDRFTLWDEIYQQYYGSTDETGQSVVVDIEQGPVRGYKSPLGEFYVFNGIPYATAPIGRDKFKAPLPPPTWTNVFEATNSNIMCHQPGFAGLTQDDCLVVNIHTPINRQGHVPVMFYIHGGGFTQGYGAMVSPEDLVEHKLVVVTINYRLGATGFVCMRDEDIPGNAAYKDQIAALRWVQQNIASFGGNPNDVTIAGFSGGGISVEFMMLSPIANGLFHKVISESGSVLIPFSEGRDPIAFAKRFASDIAGNDIDDLEEVKQLLLDATSEELFTDLYESYQYRQDASMGFTFCVEDEIDGIESFLTEAPLEVLKKGNYNKVTIMTGIASEEGSIYLPYFDDWKPEMNEHFDHFIPVGLNFANENEKNAVANRVKQFYFNNEPVSDENIRGFMDFGTDISFGYALLRSARLHVQNSVPVYLYLYTYIVSEYPRHAHDDKIRGAIHCAQSFCVNRIPWLHNRVSESENDILMRNRLTKMWSDFAKTGVPVPQTSELVSVNWEPMEYDKMNYLSMDVEMESRELLLGDRFTLWDEIYQQYYGSTDETGQSVVVDIEQGPVRGYKSPLGEFYVFNGIPYATAPIGRDKFKAPLPPPTWTNVFEATNSNIMCHQPGFAGLTQDDCLVVNIHTPINRQGHVPVMFYIHGGGFTQGYGAMVSPEDLVEHKLVVVTINYRLGATGFVCMRDEDIPGNAAYKDQIAALRWVQQNIASFGGNPNDVTIAGFSGGGISVEFMMLSPIANGLFHKVISESGSVLIPFSEGRDPIAFAKRFASDIAGNDIDDLEEVKQLLLDATSEELFTDLYESYQYRQDASMGFTFCVEDEIDGIESFLTEAPLEVLKKGNYNKVTIMTGIASEEGSIYLPYFDDWKPEMNEHFDHFIPVGLNFANENEKNAVANRVKQFYFNNEPVSDENIRGFMDFGTDISFGYALLRSARLHVQNSVPVYLYLYTYIVSEYPRHAHDDKIRGAIHCAQSFCVNRIPWLHNRVNESENDILMRNRLTKMWSDFAKTGVPVPQTSELVSVNWEPMEYDKMNYLSMDVEMEVRELLLGDRFTLWDEIYQQYYGGGAHALVTSTTILLPILLVIFNLFSKYFST